MSEPIVDTRQVKMLLVRPADFMVLFKKGLQVKGGWKVVKGLPSDAHLISIAAEGIRGGIVLVVESSTYTAIPITEMPPIEQVEIELHDRRVKHPK